MYFFISCLESLESFLAIPSSSRLEVLVRYRGTIPFLAADAFGS